MEAVAFPEWCVSEEDRELYAQARGHRGTATELYSKRTTLAFIAARAQELGQEIKQKGITYAN